MKYESELDLDDLVEDFREDYPLTTDMEIELRRVAKEVDRALVNYANGGISYDPRREFTAVVFWINNKFYADADFGDDLPVMLNVPSIDEAAHELGFHKYGAKWDEKLINSVDWCYDWTVRRRKKKTQKFSFKKSAMTRIIPFIEEFPGANAKSVFARAKRSMIKRCSQGISCPSAVVAYYDGQVFCRLFDDLKKGFASFVEFKNEHAPCVLLSIKSITIDKENK